MFRLMFLFAFLLFLWACNGSLPDMVAIESDGLPDVVDFNYHVKPILSDRCFQCHGPDEGTRKANLRLDVEESAYAKLSDGDGFAFVKGKPLRSHVIKTSYI